MKRRLYKDDPTIDLAAYSEHDPQTFFQGGLGLYCILVPVDGLVTARQHEDGSIYIRCQGLADATAQLKASMGARGSDDQVAFRINDDGVPGSLLIQVLDHDWVCVRMTPVDSPGYSLAHMMWGRSQPTELFH